MSWQPTAWELWLIAGLTLCALEIKLPGFVVFWLGIGALVAAIPAALGFEEWVQSLTFTATSLSLFFLSRPLYRRILMRNAQRVRTNVEAMVGVTATVVEAVPESGDGTVRVNGELWRARSLTGALPAGEVTVVERVEGLKVLVRKPGVGLTLLRKEDKP
jgi:membrane protein implicated in regulation of membrane protease activity